MRLFAQRACIPSEGKIDADMVLLTALAMARRRPGDEQVADCELEVRSKRPPWSSRNGS